MFLLVFSTLLRIHNGKCVGRDTKDHKKGKKSGAGGVSTSSSMVVIVYILGISLLSKLTLT